MTLRVLIADDQEMARVGLRMILDAQPDIKIVAEAATGAEAVALAASSNPDVCLLDIRMPGLDGIEATRRITSCFGAPAVVLITTFDLDEYVYGGLRAGATGFLLKDATAALVVEAVRCAASGDALLSPAVTTRLLDRFARRPAPGQTPRQPVEPLTSREEDVLVAVARGRTNPEIGDELFMSVSTVKSHVNALLTKLEARNRVELAVWAHQTGRLDGRS